MADSAPFMFEFLLNSSSQKWDVMILLYSYIFSAVQ